MAATTEEVPRPYGRGTSSVVSFVVAMNRVDVVDLVVDLVDVNLDIDLVDVDLDVDLVDVDLVDIQFVVLSMLPCGQPRSWKIVIFVFVECPRNVKKPLFGWIRASGIC